MKATLVDMEMDHWRAADAVMALDERVQAGEAVTEEEYQAALVPFTEGLALVKDKRDKMAGFLLQARKQEELFKDRAAMDTKRAKYVANLIARLESMVMFAIRCTDSNQLEGNERTMALHRNSQDTLNIKHADMLPDSCYRTEEVKVLDKETVKALIRRGEIMPSVAELTRGEHLRIK